MRSLLPVSSVAGKSTTGICVASVGLRLTVCRKRSRSSSTGMLSVNSEPCMVYPRSMSPRESQRETVFPLLWSQTVASQSMESKVSAASFSARTCLRSRSTAPFSDANCCCVL